MCPQNYSTWQQASLEEESLGGVNHYPHTGKYAGDNSAMLLAYFS